ncbi:DUF1501 domain-containing protein [Tuwongella immobilis]|uniref:Uncharacterized protein n=1 Tax=Tuwongella immobilis TaxID=692036 RepID=A0A6C2YHW5_9BACT|nr:DUF1501 domain-containing protein [Tuwongella immobilis]VIP00582.1 protein containing duf1501 : Uncharacterized protein OS=Singulisphaera acidiphila (strain ATCC BAA-1392 / DSM 18658 / VKM B-2454 / MOB10) GN=Sinac_7215 PE=4 SV=1: DUF1501 [Tuwongella immobilis]VTR96582.1 protein containing duf1501 : Uncharacterized protein OS=Singulisphaera acidiphila (strain ATCC BAA-1392 / DSM 18658 / VKM B-2454 / MOB10) GN=Sinac_7215 PE=4 SV=1: DUF1501 [Tuwongella immobilis]
MTPRCVFPCGRLSRRTFLADVGLGFTGLALGSMLHGDPLARAADPHAGPDAGTPGGPPSGKPHHPPKAKKVIWIVLSGGVSHMETFDPKPALNRYAGKSFEALPIANPMKHPYFLARSRSVVGFNREVYPLIYPLQVGYSKCGQSGIEVSDWLPRLGSVVDDLCVIRSMYTTDNDHAAEFQFHTGRHHLDEPQPSVGSWIHYGLGALNANLPQFVFLGQYSDARVKKNFDADYLGPQHAAVELSLDPNAPLPFAKPGKGVLAQEQANEFALAGELNRLAAVEMPDDPQLQARIRSYELAFRMQMAVPEAMDLRKESRRTQALYGIDNPTTAIYGQRLLAARRLAERGVRFTMVYLSDYGEWDSHQNLKTLHARSCARVDQPLTGLITDLKQRGMLDDDTLVVCMTEFGRTPGVEQRGGGTNGRDHHPHGFSIWMAGAGLKRGIVHGATDELGFHAVESPHYVTDIHATVLHLLGLDNRRLDVPGRKRLEMDHGQVITPILA